MSYGSGDNSLDARRVQFFLINKNNNPTSYVGSGALYQDCLHTFGLGWIMGYS